ncbi:MAG: saccharopine dehydrogenase family protein, partial [Planctomycetota bacterium]
MGRVLIVGAGGVGNVVTKKCANDAETFEEICLASRTIEKCEKIASEINRPIRIEKLDADNVNKTVNLINSFQPDLLINVALPYQDLPLMDACLETATDYLDTANYEPPDEARFEYKWQWAYHEKFKQKGIMALLGSGFDPGVTNVYCAYAQKNLYDEIHQIDIIDCNAGTHGK